jgi:hypothetical protein
MELGKFKNKNKEECGERGINHVGSNKGCGEEEECPYKKGRNKLHLDEKQEKEIVPCRGKLRSDGKELQVEAPHS